VEPKTVLIVDDEPLSVKILCHSLEDDYKTVLAQSGREALEIISLKAPDIILLDLIMPEMDGYEVYRQIRNDPSLDAIPVIFITMLESIECEAHGLKMGASDFVHKPFVADLVRLRVKNHLAFSQARNLLEQRSKELQALNRELESMLARVKLLEGIITICSYCHKIRTDKDDWKKLEEYISAHSEALFSHDICPECASQQMKIIENMEWKKR